MMTEIDRLGENVSEIADFKFHEIEQLPSCTYMNLHCNCLQHLDGLPHKLLTSLIELNLSSNDFTSSYLPELSYLPSLRILDLSANKLQSVIDMPFLPGLESLLVAYNLLTRLDGLEENVPHLRKLDARNNFLKDTQDVSALLALRNLDELLLGGKQPNAIYSNVGDIIYMFESCEKVKTIDGRSKSSWMAELKGVDSVSLPAPVSTPTPRFDHVARMWQSRLVKEADEQRLEETQKLLQANAQERLEELHLIEREHEEEKNRMVCMCRGLRALSLHAHSRKAARYSHKYIEKERALITATQAAVDNRRAEDLLKKRAEDRLNDEILMRSVQETEAENFKLRQEIQLIQSEHEFDIEERVSEVKGFYSLRLHSMKCKSEALISRCEQEKETLQRTILEKEEGERRRYSDNQKMLEAEEKGRVLEESQRIEREHEEEKYRMVCMCRGLRALSLHAHSRKAARYRDELKAKLSAAVTKEKNIFEGKLRQFSSEIEEGKRAISGLQSLSTHQEQEERHRSDAQKKKILTLEKLLLVMKNDVAVLTAKNAALVADERLALACDKQAENAMVVQLQDRIRAMEQEKASDAAELTMALRERGEEHRLLKEAHLKLQRRAEKAVTRLNSVHDAFLKSTEQNSQLVRDLEVMERDREARERTIEELGSCVRHLQAALRKMSHTLSVSQTEKEAEKEAAVVGARRKDGVRPDRIEVVKYPERVSSRHINAGNRSDSEDDSDIESASVHLNESTDFLNRISFNGKEELEGGSGDKGLEGMRSNAGRRTGADIEMTKSPLKSMAGSAEYDTGCTDAEKAAMHPQSRGSGLKCSDGGGDSEDSKYAQLALKLDALDKELRQRVADLMLAGQRISSLSKSEIDLQTAVRVKDLMLSDQNEMVFDLRGRLSEAEKEIADLRSAHHEMESFLESSKEEAHEMLDKLTRKAEKEKQHKAAIDGLEASNSRLRQELELYRDDDSTCSSSNSSSSSSSSSKSSNSSHSSISGDDSCIVLGSRAERGEGLKSETGDVNISHNNSQHRHTQKHRDRDRERDGAQASKLTPQEVLTIRKSPPKGFTPGLGPRSAESGGLEIQVRGPDSVDLGVLKKQLRATSRRELKGWVISLTKGLIETQQKIPSDMEVEENEKARKQHTSLVQGLEAELLTCSQAAKEFKKGREEAESLLLRKEKEGLRAAQSMVMMQSKLEQLCMKLQIEQERNSMISESYQSEKKHLARTVRQLQGECSGKEEEFRRLKAVTDQLRMLVATGSLNI